MSGSYDATIKEIILQDPDALLKLLHLQGTHAQVENTDLTLIARQPDILLSVNNPDYLLHLEIQASYDPEISLRILDYHVLSLRTSDYPVISALLLLRPQADGPKVTGEWKSAQIHFKYDVFRLWEIPASEALSLPVSLLPLVPLCNLSGTSAEEVISKIDSRLKVEQLEKQAKITLWVKTYVLLGLKYNESDALNLLKGVDNMEESSTYLAIIKKGTEKGIQIGTNIGFMQGEQQMLIKILQYRFGTIPEAKMRMLASIDSIDELDRLSQKVVKANSLDEVFA